MNHVTWAAIQVGNISSSEVMCLKLLNDCSKELFYRVSIKSFPDYKHLLQENYVEYKHMQL